jgi:hypothetical protein
MLLFETLMLYKTYIKLKNDNPWKAPKDMSYLSTFRRPICLSPSEPQTTIPFGEKILQRKKPRIYN